MKTYEINGTRIVHEDGTQTIETNETLLSGPVAPPPDPEFVTRFNFEAGDIPISDIARLKFNKPYRFGDSVLEFRKNPDNGKMIILGDGRFDGRRDLDRTWKHQQFLMRVSAWRNPGGSGAGTPWYQPYSVNVRYTYEFEPVGFADKKDVSWVIPLQYYPGVGQTEDGGQNPMLAPRVTTVGGELKWAISLKVGDRTLPPGMLRPGPGEVRRTEFVPFWQGRQTWVVDYLAHKTDGLIVISIDGEEVFRHAGVTTLTTTAESAMWGPAPATGPYTYDSPARGYGFRYSLIRAEEEVAATELFAPGENRNEAIHEPTTWMTNQL